MASTAKIILQAHNGTHRVVFTDPALVAAKRIPVGGVSLENLPVSSTSRGVLLALAQKEAKRRKCAFIDETAV